MRDAQGRVRPRVRSCGGRNGEWLGGEEACVVFPKKGEEEEKRRGVSQESPQVFVYSLPVLKNETFFSRKIRLFEIKILLLRLIKHNFPFIPPHCGVYIAQSRGTFPNPPAQTLFDLLNPSRLCLIPAYQNSPKRRCPSQSGDIYTTATRAPLGFVRKEGGAKACFSSTRKGALAFFGQRALGNPIHFLSCPHAANRSSLIDFWGLAF